MQDGFYWIQIKGDRPEVVEIYHERIFGEYDHMNRTGEECAIRFKDGKWRNWDDPIDIIVLSGPLEVPEHTI